MICFHFSIFEPQETVQPTLQIDFQLVINHFEIQKRCCFQLRIPHLSGISFSRKALIADREYLYPKIFSHKTTLYFQIAYL